MVDKRVDKLKKKERKISLPWIRWKCSKHNGLFEEIFGKKEQKRARRMKNFRVNCKSKWGCRMKKVERERWSLFFMGERRGWWVGEYRKSEREKESCACIFNYCMLHHAHIHKNLCFVPNTNFSGQMVKWERRAGMNSFVDPCCRVQNDIAHSSDFVYGKCNFRAFLSLSSSHQLEYMAASKW